MNRLDRLARLASKVRRVGLTSALSAWDQALSGSKPVIKIVDTSIGKYYVVANDALSEALASGKIHEAHFHDMAALVIGRSDNVIDLGANLGTHTVCMAKRADHGRTYSFEPLSLTFSQLQMNILANKLTNVFPYKLAASDVTGSYLQMDAVDYSGANFNVGGTRVAKEGKGRDGVLSIRLDDLELPRIAFIKMDIQGSECAAVRGMSALIARDRPLIFVEIEELHLQALNSSSKELIEHFFDKGYALFRIKTEYPCDHLAVPLERVAEIEAQLAARYPYPVEKLQGKAIELTFADGGNNYTSYAVR